MSCAVAGMLPWSRGGLAGGRGSEGVDITGGGGAEALKDAQRARLAEVRVLAGPQLLICRHITHHVPKLFWPCGIGTKQVAARMAFLCHFTQEIQCNRTVVSTVTSQ